MPTDAPSDLCKVGLIHFGRIMINLAQVSKCTYDKGYTKFFNQYLQIFPIPFSVYLYGCFT